MANRRTKKKRYVYHPAFEDATPKDKGTVVSLSRFRWKLKHDEATERVIRLVRFIWMRDLAWEDRYKLHSGVLGAAMRQGYVVRDDKKLTTSPAGSHLVKESGR